MQSSGSDSDAASQKGSDAVPDALDSRTEPMTRHDSGSATNNFTAIAHREQASAWARDLQWGGGLTLAALILAFGWTTVRPGPRRRTPEVPAPAWSRHRRR